MTYDDEQYCEPKIIARLVVFALTVASVLLVASPSSAFAPGPNQAMAGALAWDPRSAGSRSRRVVRETHFANLFGRTDARLPCAVHLRR